MENILGRFGRQSSKAKPKLDGDEDDHDGVHDYRVVTFTRPAFCSVCEEFLWGIAKQGLRCGKCGKHSHRKCLTKAGKLVCSHDPEPETDSMDAPPSSSLDMENALFQTFCDQGYARDEILTSMHSVRDVGVDLTQESLQQVLERRAARRNQLGESCGGLTSEGADDDDMLCVICFERPKTSLLLPCKHLCLCSSCQVGECPMCRTNVGDRIDGIFL